MKFSKLLHNSIIITLVIFLGLSLSGCDSKETSSVIDLVIILGNHSNAPKPKIKDDLKNDILDTLESEGNICIIIDDGDPYSVDLTSESLPSGISSSKREELLTKKLNAIISTSEQMLSKTPEIDILNSLILASRKLKTSKADTKKLVLIDPMLNTSDPMDLSEEGLTSISIEETVKQLDELGYIADLSLANQIDIYNLGDVAAPQSDLSEQDKDKLEDLWNSIFESSGASNICFKSDLPGSETFGNEDLPSVSVIPTTKINNVISYSNFDKNSIVKIDNTLVHFEANSDDLVNEELSIQNLQSTIEYFGSNNNEILLVGTTEKSGKKQDCLDLSLKRAKKIKKMLENGGIDSNRIYCIGTGYDSDFYENDWVDGVFNEEVGKKNRAVYLLDYSGDDAKKLIKTF